MGLEKLNLRWIGYNENKTRDAIAYVKKHPRKVPRLLYLADRHSVTKCGIPITGCPLVSLGLDLYPPLYTKPDMDRTGDHLSDWDVECLDWALASTTPLQNLPEARTYCPTWIEVLELVGKADLISTYKEWLAVSEEASILFGGSRT